MEEPVIWYNASLLAEGVGVVIKAISMGLISGVVYSALFKLRLKQ